MTAPANTPSVWTFAGNAKDIQRLLARSAQDLPRAALLCLNRREAATLLGTAALDSLEAVAQAATHLRAAVCEAVVITGDEADHADTPQASGWLSPSATTGQTQSHPDADAVFADAAAQALARGFVAMEAIVMACMARQDALSRHTGTGPLQPRPDFAQRSANLPHFSLPRPTTVSGFAALGDVDLGLYAVVGSAAWVARVVAAGVRTVQLRIKDAEGPEHRDFVRQQVRESIHAATAAGAQLFINDHWQLAIEEGAYGVHLGQEDLPIADLAAIAQAGLRLGISTHAYWEVCRAWALRPSYMACGPIHPTQAKAMPWIPQGNDNLAYWCALLPLPVVGIAGMDVARTEQAARAGAAGVAVISAITAAASPETAIAQLQEAIRRGRASPPAAAPTFPKPTLLPTP
ncbi:MAG: thiamine phosphate synthase [Polaromonas sp.]|uniref:thiamine phosphate synthase n=1 Tax=Polaromonas sp. TaxID=1869339 RepID=UPI0027314145|nr:thiamine phosphate synthase [Polaromonas sp.]MDP2449031.1 thiamine phosphate synthase [Polaromonas sp.]MDP3249417.1 thiamine phosphate synthase [Polaromonas sp.]MDP3754433.1 thiamine phosphate synthase [Polaromonas sp.]MDP3826921.1 thiamine phosphate synthase [Polaromonas sp.]